MKTPNELYEALIPICKEARDNIVELFKKHDITWLDTSEEACQMHGVDACWAIYSFGEALQETRVNRVKVEDGCVELMLDDGYGEDLCWADDDDYMLYSLLSVYDTVYHMLKS